MHQISFWLFSKGHNSRKGNNSVHAWFIRYGMHVLNGWTGAQPITNMPHQLLSWGHKKLWPKSHFMRKPGYRVAHQSKMQTGLLSYRSQLFIKFYCILFAATLIFLHFVHGMKLCGKSCFCLMHFESIKFWECFILVKTSLVNRITHSQLVHKLNNKRLIGNFTQVSTVH